MTIKKLLSKTTCIILFTATILLFTSCSKKIVLSNAGVAPAAKGTIKVKNDKNKNYTIDVKIMHLAPAENLNPPKKTYVIWMETENNGTKNIGQLNSSSGFISKALKGSLRTVTSFKPVSFFITAEDDGAITYPGNTVILKSN